MLLVTLEYDQAEMVGPPFSVPTEEMMRNYRDSFAIEQLHGEDIIDEQPRWRKVGLTALRESVFALARQRNP
jgi:thiopurine S-methyltransferase